MARIVRILLSALLAALVPATAHAAAPDGGRSVQRWDAIYAVQPDGSADVTVEIDFDFGNDPGHGPYWTLPVRQGYDDTYDRVYDVTDVDASSPSGAPANVYLEEGDDWLVVRVGDEGIDDVAGVQTYVLTYTVHDVMNSTDAGDEFYWNAIGDSWGTPISDISVTVTDDADVTDTRCFAGPVGGTAACDSATSSGGQAEFTQSALEPGEPMSVAVAYPAGTHATEPVLRESNELAHAFSINGWTVGGFLLILLSGLALVVRRIRNAGADLEYADFTPGVGPAGGEAAAVRKRDKRAPVAVAFAPPDGLRPGQLGTLVDEKADVRDVTATMVDLAVRGYLVIEALEGDDYALVKQRDADDALYPYEQMLFDAMFEGRDRVTLGDLKTTFHADLAKVQAQLYRNVTNAGWFRSNPTHARGAWAGAGIALVVAGVFATIAAAVLGTSIALIPVALVLVGLVVLATTAVAPARTPEGSRVLAQTRGFELYLRTAEAEQLRFEEGHDLFSRYLPYAIAFGDAEQWSKKFEQLAAQGVRLAEPTWYRGYGFGYGLFWAHAAGFGHRMSEFTAMADAAISAPTPGSSGGSGFSSGGGFSGGGGGGGGGGGW
ncbi:DUF2207 domain-containing protein [Demequina mangrovi]|uniref:TIGR04222 domain-containing protein n=1 Tax=Demequina mangrovi TaxID=1043493 RepID=A0A1H6XWN7_9MICO|nr:DUF2207 domain-containing protein [Demequina mangrovi]SEJ32034.1 TIGR04222 domain-containing protein [Demequina mangrovi]